MGTDNNPAKWYMARIRECLLRGGRIKYGTSKPIPYIAKRLNLNPTTVLRLTLPKEGGNSGTDGVIPAKYLMELIKIAQELGVTEISLDDLVK